MQEEGEYEEQEQEEDRRRRRRRRRRRISALIVHYRIEFILLAKYGEYIMYPRESNR